MTLENSSERHILAPEMMRLTLLIVARTLFGTDADRHTDQIAESMEIAIDRIELEMLEGMAPAQAEAVREDAGRLLLYAPVVARDDFEAGLLRDWVESSRPEPSAAHWYIRLSEARKGEGLGGEYGDDVWMQPVRIAWLPSSRKAGSRRRKPAARKGPSRPPR